MIYDIWHFKLGFCGHSTESPNISNVSAYAQVWSEVSTAITFREPLLHLELDLFCFYCVKSKSDFKAIKQFAES